MTHHITQSQPSTEVRAQSRPDWSKAAMFAALVAFGLMTGLVGAWVIEDAFTELNFHALQGCGAC